MIVADTNLIVHLFIVTDETPFAEACGKRDPIWIAPPIWRHEFMNALAQHMRLKALPLDSAMKALQTADELIETRIVRGRETSVLDWAVKHASATYDAEFADLAEVAGVRVVTADKAFLEKLGRKGVSPQAFAAGG